MGHPVCLCVSLCVCVIGVYLWMSRLFVYAGCSSVVDLGCGRGDYLKELKAYGLKVQGFDGQ